MPRRKRSQTTIAAARQSSAASLRLGRELRETRRRRQLTQAALAGRIGLDRTRISQVERGGGGNLRLQDWFAIAEALGRPLRFELARDTLEPADAGHLAVQELILRATRGAGFDRSFELATRPAEPSRSVDIGLRDDRQRRLVVVEAWNTFGDIGSAARSFDRKLAEAAQLAVAVGGERGPYAVAGCWVVRASVRNRALVGQYPQVFATRFPGPSELWLRALTAGTTPPASPGMLWADVAAGRLIAWRRRGT